MNRILRIILFGFGVVFLISCTAPTAPSVSASLDQLELEKLALEVAQLKQDQQLFIWTRVISFAGSLIASIAVLWTIAQGYQTLRNQAAGQKHSRISEILTSLSSDNEMTRIGAARSLSRYPNETIDEILSALRFETSAVVREVLEETLEKISAENFVRLLNANARTLADRAKLLGRLHALGVNDSYACTLLSLSAHSAKTLTRYRDFRYKYDHGLQSQTHEQKLLEQLDEPSDKNSRTLILTCQQATNLAKSTSKVIARLLRAGYKVGSQRIHVDLTASNLYRVNLQKAQLPNSIFSRSIMRHINFNQAQLSYSDFSHCNMYEANLRDADLSHSLFISVNLLNAVADRVSFRLARIMNTGFSRGNFNQADFSKCSGSDVRFKGITAKDIRFDECDFEAVHFEGAVLINSSFNNARIFRSTWRDCKIIDSNLHMLRLNGSDLSCAKFTGSDLLNADLSCCDLNQADFRGAKNISTVKLDGVKNLEHALFDN